MKTGMNLLLWTTEVTAEHDGLLDQLRETGFDAVEVPVFNVEDRAPYERLGKRIRSHGFGATAVTGRFVAMSMIRELGAVLTGIMVSGRNASSMASELGSMVVTEQIDAMRALGTDPLKKLVTPRVVATVFMLFFLTIIADLVGLIGGYIYSRARLGLDTY